MVCLCAWTEHLCLHLYPGMSVASVLRAENEEHVCLTPFGWMIDWFAHDFQ